MTKIIAIIITIVPFSCYLSQTWKFNQPALRNGDKSQRRGGFVEQISLAKEAQESVTKVIAIITIIVSFLCYLSPTLMFKQTALRNGDKSKHRGGFVEQISLT